MYCPECGKQNEDNALFCYECGTALQMQNETPVENIDYGNGQTYPPIENTGYSNEQNYQYNTQNTGTTTVPKKPMNKQTKIIIGAVFGAFALLLIGISVLTMMFSPEKTAENYFKALSEGDYSKMYSYVIDSEQKYVTETEFVEYMEANNYILPDSVEGFKCNETISGGGYTGSVDSSVVQTHTCNINYNLNGEITQRSYFVDIVKVSGIIPTYKVSIMDILVSDVTVRAVKGATVFIDSKQLAVQENTDEYSFSDDYDTYVANVLLSGVHTLKIEHEMYDTIEGEIYIDSYDNYFSYTVMDLKADTRTKIFNQSTDIFKSMCAAAMSSKDFSAVNGNIASDADTYQNLAYAYNNFKNRIKNDDGVGYSNLNFTSFTDATTDFQLNNNRYTCKVNYVYDNVYVYKDYRSATGYSQRTTTGAEGYIYLTFELVDGDWQLVVIRDYRI